MTSEVCLLDLTFIWFKFQIWAPEARNDEDQNDAFLKRLIKEFGRDKNKRKWTANLPAEARPGQLPSSKATLYTTASNKGPE